MYACAGSACRTDCANQTDCLAGFFCDGMSCQQKKGDGVPCSLPNECNSGYCVSAGSGTSVCCSSACDPTVIPGATCAKAGHVGQCECQLDCGDAGACRLFYRDFDGDSYGDLNTTQVGCSNAPPPAGYVADNTDCDDHDGNVHPGQTAYYGSPSLGTGTYDYNCDGTIEKQTPEYTNGQSCEYCGSSGGGFLNCSSSATCSSSGEQSGFGCGLTSRGCSTICIIGCGTSSDTGFTSTVSCGATGTLTYCGTCAAAGGSPASSTGPLQQLCH